MLERTADHGSYRRKDVTMDRPVCVCKNRFWRLYLLVILGCLSLRTATSASRKAYEVGKAGNFTCHLPDNTYSPKSVAFITSDNSTVPGKTVILGETLVMLTIPVLNLNDSGRVIYCFYNDTQRPEILERMKITVGYPPGRPKEFYCVSYHQKAFACYLDVVPDGDIKSTWTIEYTTRLLDEEYRPCQNQDWSSSGGDDYLVCSWYDDFNPYLVYTIRVRGSNPLGNHTEIHIIKPWLIVQPEAVNSVESRPINSTCLNITWTDESDFLEQPYCQYVVYAQSKFHVAQPLTMLRISSRDTFWMPVCGVTPFSIVNITVVSAPLEGGFTSDSRSIHVKTPTDLPSIRGITPVSFTVTNKQQVALYWQSLPRESHHGKFLGYLVKVFKNVKELLFHEQFVDRENCSCKINVNPDTSTSYLVSLQAKNEIGLSEPTWLKLPKSTDTYARTTEIAWVDTIMMSDKEYNVSWWFHKREPTEDVSLKKCFGEIVDEVVLCKNSITTTLLSYDKTSLMVRNLTERYSLCLRCSWQFGLALASSKNIIWNSCRYRKYKPPSDFDVEVKRKGSVVVVTWRDKCLTWANWGRPDHYEIAMVKNDNSSRSVCANVIGEVVAATPHDVMYKELDVNNNDVNVICMRALSENRPSRWVSSVIPADNAPEEYGVPVGAVAGIVVSLLLLFIAMTTLIVCCVKRQKICGLLPVQIPEMSTMDELEPEKLKFLNGSIIQADRPKSFNNEKMSEVKELLNESSNFDQSSKTVSTIVKDDQVRTPSPCSLVLELPPPKNRTSASRWSLTNFWKPSVTSDSQNVEDYCRYDRSSTAVQPQDMDQEHHLQILPTCQVEDHFMNTPEHHSPDHKENLSSPGPQEKLSSIGTWIIQNSMHKDDAIDELKSNTTSGSPWYTPSECDDGVSGIHSLGPYFLFQESTNNQNGAQLVHHRSSLMPETSEFNESVASSDSSNSLKCPPDINNLDSQEIRSKSSISQPDSGQRNITLPLPAKSTSNLCYVQIPDS